jgi:hypothetical protein
MLVRLIRGRMVGGVFMAETGIRPGTRSLVRQQMEPLWKKDVSAQDGSGRNVPPSTGPESNEADRVASPHRGVLRPEIQLQPADSQKLTVAGRLKNGTAVIDSLRALN